MNKITEFYTKAMADDSVKKDFMAILAGKSIEEASDEQLLKIGELAKRLEMEISLEEAKAYLNGDGTELDEEDLDAVAGGGKYDNSVVHIIYCEIGGTADPV